MAFYNNERLQQRKSSKDNISMSDLAQVQQAFPDAEIAEQQFEEQYKNELEDLELY
ncbi:hypothetical protein [Pallidibacillus pasinlerensis]|uniref:YfhD family protein n=1 Tax=Pallidibacillus pasinlerensis TaxID=2703818 RepID=A0ABX0A1Y6_9BACI|nr:hypothetical protein [Pallidibacillus pasinlerensis]NCU16584.1 hypothetical protein [Pallidibacillus pasinlerensis]